MVQFPNPGVLWHFDGPLGMGIHPTALHIHVGLAVGVHNHLRACVLKSFGELSDKQLGSTVIHRGNGNEWRNDESYPHPNPTSGGRVSFLSSAQLAGTPLPSA